jgi:hypothetical protein
MHRAWGTLVGLVGLGVALYTVPHRLCALGADAWYDGDADAQEAFARRVEGWLSDPTLERAFATGSSRFDNEWTFGTYQMAALGFGQVASEHVETKPLQRPRMERAIDALLSKSGQRFDSEAWGVGALASLGSDQGHVAYLGYTNLVLGLHRVLYPDSKYATLGDAITATLERRFSHSRSLMLETYPGETYPVDNSAAIASIALHAKAVHVEEPEIVHRWEAAVRRRYIDPGSGLLVQAAHRDGARDVARGSGTTLAAYFLSFMDSNLSLELHRAVQRSLSQDVLGFDVVREYPAGKSGRGDIDSGPLVFGLSVSATGFALAGCRIHQNQDCFERTLATATLFGAPVTRSGGHGYVSGGPLGDAILFAMQTAQKRPS